MAVRYPLAAPSALTWLATGFIGDIVLTTAAVELAAREFPGVRQRVITTPVGVKVLGTSPHLQELIAFDKRKKTLISAALEIRARLRDAAGAGSGHYLMQAHRSFRSSLLACATGLPVIGYREADLPWTARHRVPRVAVFHEAVRIALLLEPFGVERRAIAAARPRLDPLTVVPDTDWAGQVAGLAGKRVGIAPGSVWGTKRWLPERYIEVCRALVAAGAAVILIGSDAEKPLCDQVEAGAAAGARVLNLAGRTRLDHLAWLYPQLHLVVANDSSPVHFASAFNIPTLAVFGATLPEMGFGPLGDRSAVFGTVLDCRPCSDHGPATCPLGHFRCMRDQPAAPVIEAALRILA